MTRLVHAPNPILQSWLVLYNLSTTFRSPILSFMARHVPTDQPVLQLLQKFTNWRYPLGSNDGMDGGVSSQRYLHVHEVDTSCRNISQLLPSLDIFASRWKRRSRLVRMHTIIRALGNRRLTGIGCITRKRERRAVPEWPSVRNLVKALRP